MMHSGSDDLPFDYKCLGERPASRLGIAPAVRLLHVLPGRPDALLELRLGWYFGFESHGQLYISQSPTLNAEASKNQHVLTNYRCLSYRWGEPVDSHTILINGHPFAVRKSLYHFLQIARKQFPGQLLWIDAICINQNDVSEKNIEVKRMSDIYRGAKEVMIWLGESEGFVTLFKWIDEFHGHHHPESAPPEEILRDMFSLCSNPYWKRTWILQEVLLAQKARLLHGTCEMQFDHILDALMTASAAKRADNRLLPSAYHVLDSAPVKLGNYSRALTSTAQNLRVDGMSIGSLLRWCDDTHCFDTRDRVYALLSLVRDSASFPVNYSEDCYSLFWRTVQHFSLSRDDDLNRLRNALELTWDGLLNDAGRKPYLSLNFSGQCYPLSTLHKSITGVPSKENTRQRSSENSKPSISAACHNCKQVFHGKPNDILVCLAREQDWVDQLFNRYSHCLIEESLHITLIPSLNDAAPTAYVPDATVSYSNGTSSWACITNYPTLRTLCNPGHETGSTASASLFRLNLPPGWFLEQIKSPGDIEY